MTKNKDNKFEKLSKRIESLELVLGFDKDGKRNGNGLITLVERIDKGQSEIWRRMETLKTDMESMNTKLNKINDTWKDLSFDIRTLNENIKNMEQKIKSFEGKIEEHAKAIDKSITPNKLRDVVKDFGLFAGFFLTLGTIFGIIAYLYNRIRGHI